MKTGYSVLSKYFFLSFFKAAVCCIVVNIISSFSFSQTTNISGVVNSYHSVLSIASANSVKLDNTTGLAYGNTVLLIQMKGATINTTASSSSFGDITAINDAGNYELAIICSVSNDTVSFFNDILNTYDVNSKVQLVKFGEYYAANVIDTLKAQAWDNVTGKGGVLAIRVDEDLTLNAPISADAAGYKGGAFYLHNGTCGFFTPVGTNYAYDATSTTANNGAYKGEGIADVPSTLDGARGAPANGGGGGNNHNNGGGGGANLTAGGNGGGNFSTGPSGCNTSGLQGRGGKALNNSGNTKIFAGGGGGAGHANNTVQPYAGGDGGGIIIILAKNIIGNGFTISANGQDGHSTSYDGASGGGGAGTIIMNVTGSYSGSLFINANGGNGGNEDDDNSAGRCYGAGGGGSGGAIYFKASSSPAITSVTGGIAGINIDVNGCNAPVSPVNGSSGLVTTSYSYRTSTTPSSNCTAAALPVRIIYFDAKPVADKQVKLEWDIANPDEANTFTVEKLDLLNHWSELTTLNAEESVHHYEIKDINPQPGENIYRLRINSKDNSHVYSIQKKVFINYNNRFSVYPNPAKDKITISGKLNPGTTISLTDIIGKLIKDKIIGSASLTQEFQLPILTPGIYLVKIQNEVKKIVVR